MKKHLRKVLFLIATSAAVLLPAQPAEAFFFGFGGGFGFGFGSGWGSHWYRPWGYHPYGWYHPYHYGWYRPWGYTPYYYGYTPYYLPQPVVTSTPKANDTDR